MDISKNREFAQYLEENLSNLLKYKVECAAIVAKIEDGDVYTGYFNVDATDMAIFAHNISADIVLEIVKRNIDQVREALEELEADDG